MPVSKSWLAEDLFRLNRACPFHCGRTCQLANVTQRCRVQEPEGVVGCVLVQAHRLLAIQLAWSPLTALTEELRSELSKEEGGGKGCCYKCFCLSLAALHKHQRQNEILLFKGRSLFCSLKIKHTQTNSF